MLKQVFSKLFNTETNQNQNTNNRYENRRPIYNPVPVPTISSCFQQQSSNTTSSLTSYYNANDDNQTNTITSQSIDTSRTNSSMSSNSSPRSCSSNENNNSSNTSNNKKTSNNKFFSFNFASNLSSTSSNSNFKNSSTRQIYIAPHCIRYTNSTLDDTVYRIDNDSLNEIAAEILESDTSPPKLQIVHYDNKYFSINNSHLQIYKQMQYSGLITHVQADVISVEAIPIQLRKHLLATPSNLASSNSEECDEDEEDDDAVTATDDEFQEDVCYEESQRTTSRASSRINVGSSSTSSGILSDIITQNSIERLSKDMLVDETYEFGMSENCVESDLEEEEEGVENVLEKENQYENDQEEDDEDEDTENDNDDVAESNNFENVRMINKFIAQKIFEENQKKNSSKQENFKQQQQQFSSAKDIVFKNIDDILTNGEAYFREDNELNEYQKFVMSVSENKKASKTKPNSLSNFNRRGKDDQVNTGTEENSNCELKNLLSQDE